MTSIVVVEDEQVSAWSLKGMLQSEGYELITARSGEDAVQCALRETPHLLIVDLMLPGMDGDEVVRHLRAHPKSMHLPIIVVGATGEPAEMVRAFERGADDYLTRPFHPDELLARIRGLLRRAQRNVLSALTALPGGLQIEFAITDRLRSLKPWSMLYLDLDNFKAYNDVYGFLVGNELIRLVGRISRRMVQQYGNADDFVGHIGGDDFVIVTTPERTQPLCVQIRVRYHEESIALYPQEDLHRGSIRGRDRQGQPAHFPLVSLSIGVVNSQVRRPSSMQEVSSLAAEAKCRAKRSTNHLCFLLSAM